MKKLTTVVLAALLIGHSSAYANSDLCEDHQFENVGDTYSCSLNGRGQGGVQPGDASLGFVFGIYAEYEKFYSTSYECTFDRWDTLNPGQLTYKYEIWALEEDRLVKKGLGEGIISNPTTQSTIIFDSTTFCPNNPNCFFGNATYMPLQISIQEIELEEKTAFNVNIKCTLTKKSLIES